MTVVRRRIGERRPAVNDRSTGEPFISTGTDVQVKCLGESTKTDCWRPRSGRAGYEDDTGLALPFNGISFVGPQ